MTHYDSDTLTDYVKGELPPEIDARVATHLASCEECRTRHDLEARLVEVLRAAARAEEREMPAMIRARVWDAVRREQPSIWERLRGWGPIIAVPAAAAVALVAYLGLPLTHPVANNQQLTGVAASYYLDEHRAEAEQNPLADHGITPAAFTGDRTTPAASTTIDAADAATLDGSGAPQD